MNRFIEELEISNVYQIVHSITSDIIDIFFTLNKQLFSIRVERLNINSTFMPGIVYHESDEHCFLCHKRDQFSRCLSLSRHRQDLFHKLIEQPGIRLEWLYLPYEEKTKRSVMKNGTNID